MSKNRGNKQNISRKDLADPDRFVEVDSYMRRGLNKALAHAADTRQFENEGFGFSNYYGAVRSRLSTADAED